MKIHEAIETPEGSVTIQGELNPQELGLVLSIGLNYLMQQGAIPFLVKQEDREKAQADTDQLIHPASDVIK